MRRFAVAVAVLFISSTLGAQTTASKRPIRVGDLYRLKTVSDPQISPEGKWVAYVVTTTDSAKDKTDSDVWMTAWDGSQTIQVTSSPRRTRPDKSFLAAYSPKKMTRFTSRQAIR